MSYSCYSSRRMAVIETSCLLQACPTCHYTWFTSFLLCATKTTAFHHIRQVHRRTLWTRSTSTLIYTGGVSTEPSESLIAVEWRGDSAGVQAQRGGRGNICIYMYSTESAGCTLAGVFNTYKHTYVCMCVYVCSAFVFFSKLFLSL